jgi:DNA primase
VNAAEQVKSQLDIVDVIQQYVPLKRQGSARRWKGLCPFHTEKTASFNVDGGLQFYKCFGCDAKGDVFTFIQQIESLTFPEALRLLADRYGIVLPERHHAGDPEAQRYAALLQIHEAAATMYQDNLRGPNGGEAREYLRSRGVVDQAIGEFRLGFADTSGQQVAQRLRQFGESLLLEAGLLAKRDDGSLYERFRGRIIFPIHDTSGKVIAFGGRALRKDDKIKYLNSTETKLYRKSTVLYNLHRAKVAARKHDRMVLVEGYMDAIGVSAAGVPEVVALCGTALSTVQIRSMKQEISYQAGKGHVILNLDSDSAGSRSTEKHIAPLLAQGVRIRVLDIPGGLDPDEYIQANGPDAYKRLLDQAPTYFNWLIDHARSKFDVRTAEGRIDAFQSLLPAVEQVHDRLERAAIAREVAEQLGVERETVQQALRPKGATVHTQRPREVSSSAAPNERLLIACMLASSESRTLVREYLRDEPEATGLELLPVFQALIEDEGNGQTFSLTRVLEKLSEREQQIVSEISFSESQVLEEQASNQVRDCLKSLREKVSFQRQDSLKKRIRELETQGNLSEAMQLMGELEASRRSNSKM